jgi:hypothetical protein
VSGSRPLDGAFKWLARNLPIRGRLSSVLNNETTLRSKLRQLAWEQIKAILQ